MAVPHRSMAIGSPIAAADPIPCVLGDPLKSGDALTVAAPPGKGEGPTGRLEGPCEGSGAPGQEPPRAAMVAPIMHERESDLHPSADPALLLDQLKLPVFDLPPTVAPLIGPEQAAFRQQERADKSAWTCRIGLPHGEGQGTVAGG